MNKKFLVLFTIVSVSLFGGWQSQLDGFLGGMSNSSSGSTTANSEEDISVVDMNLALKEALKVGVNYAVSTLGKEDGFLNNPLVKIPLPENLQKSAKIVSKFGGQKYVNDLVVSINRAAAKAAPESAEVFVKAIKNMSIDDAKKILSGRDDAATDYFRKHTGDRLVKIMKPIVKDSMKENSVYSYYKIFNLYYKKHAKYLQNDTVTSLAKGFGFNDYLPSTKDKDLDEYITKKAIDGLMLMIAQKEKAIRANPLMQNSDIVKKVFSLF